MRRAHSRTLTAAYVLVVALAVVGGPRGALGKLTDATSSQVRPEQEQIAQSGILTETVWVSTAIRGGGLGDPVKVSYRRFSEEGRVLEQVTYDADGTVLQSMAHTYDGRRVVETLSEMSQERSPSRTTFHYDDEGRLVESVGYDADGNVLVRMEYAYDADGRMTGIRTDAQAGGQMRLVFEHDGNGNLTETTVFGAADSILSRAVSTFDSEGNKLSATSYGPAGEVLSTTVCTYGTGGALQDIRVLNAEGAVVQHVSSEYDEAGNVLQTLIENPAADTLTKMVFEYDDSGIKTSETM